jgi:hypothetical protein
MFAPPETTNDTPWLWVAALGDGLSNDEWLPEINLTPPLPRAVVETLGNPIISANGCPPIKGKDVVTGLT